MYFILYMNHFTTWQTCYVACDFLLLEINISSFVLSIGWQRSEEALKMMDKAIMPADKKNRLPMYQKANILVSMENLDEALKVLEEFKEYAPHESSVYDLMGKIYKRRNMYDKAMLHFGLALDLKPPATDVATIKVIGSFLNHTSRIRLVSMQTSVVQNSALLS